MPASGATAWATAATAVPCPQPATPPGQNCAEPGPTAKLAPPGHRLDAPLPLSLVEKHASARTALPSVEEGPGFTSVSRIAITWPAPVKPFATVTSAPIAGNDSATVGASGRSGSMLRIRGSSESRSTTPGSASTTSAGTCS